MAKTIAVAVNVYKEPERQVRECLSRIARNLPGAAVTVFLNGEDRPELLRTAEAHGFSLVAGENLGTNATWHLWWLRMLHFFRDMKADVCFKFDPDTMVDAAPKAIPSADYFGSVWLSRRYRIPFIQGGITGLSKRAVRRLLDSDLLTHMQAPIAGEEGSDLADDHHLGWALAQLGIRPAAWPECHSEWKTPVANRRGEFAIVHPRYYS